MFLASEDSGLWRSAYGVALATASAIPGACEVVAVATGPWLGESLASLGFHMRGENPVFVYDRAQRFARLPSPLIQMVDSDAFLMYDPSYPYLT